MSAETHKPFRASLSLPAAHARSGARGGAGGERGRARACRATQRADSTRRRRRGAAPPPPHGGGQPAPPAPRAAPQAVQYGPRGARGADAAGSLSWLVDLISDPKPPEPQVKPFDPEEMTKQERISRMLHAPHTHRTRRSDAPIFEHFLVWRWPGAGEEQPLLVLNYPLGKPPEIPGLVDFCFPAGWTRRKAGEEGARNEFVFMLTTDDGPLFGMVVHAPLEPCASQINPAAHGLPLSQALTLSLYALTPASLPPPL